MVNDAVVRGPTLARSLTHSNIPAENWFGPNDSADYRNRMNEIDKMWCAVSSTKFFFPILDQVELNTANSQFSVRRRTSESANDVVQLFSSSSTTPSFSLKQYTNFLSDISRTPMNHSTNQFQAGLKKMNK